MNIYKVSCESKGKNYFDEYLQSITVIAASKESAKEYTKKWLKDNDANFIYPEEEWETTLICGNIQNGMVIDAYEGRDIHW